MPITRRRLLGLLAGTAAFIGLPAAWFSRGRTYEGPISDHFDGFQFYDPDGVPPKSLASVARWQLDSNRQRVAWPEWAPSPYADTPPPRVTGDKVRLSFVGHASWLIQTAGLNILVDPVWSMRVSPVSWAGPRRHNDPGIAFEALPDIDIVLVSHGHYDHLDLPTLSRLAEKFSPRVITPLGNDLTMIDADAAIKAEGFDWKDRVELGNGIAVPHGKYAPLKGVVAVFLKLGKPVEFEAVDDQKVDIVMMLLAPMGAGADHLKALARVARILRTDSIADALRRTDDPRRLYAVLTQPMASTQAA